MPFLSQASFKTRRHLAFEHGRCRLHYGAVLCAREGAQVFGPAGVDCGAVSFMQCSFRQPDFIYCARLAHQRSHTLSDLAVSSGGTPSPGARPLSPLRGRSNRKPASLEEATREVCGFSHSMTVPVKHVRVILRKVIGTRSTSDSVSGIRGHHDLPHPKQHYVAPHHFVVHRFPL